jgi:hypothetical protein
MLRRLKWLWFRIRHGHWPWEEITGIDLSGLVTEIPIRVGGLSDATIARVVAAFPGETP